MVETSVQNIVRGQHFQVSCSREYEMVETSDPNIVRGQHSQVSCLGETRVSTS